MNMKQLEYFITISKCGSINQAAAECFVSQPSMNYSITSLEKELGIKLFSRTNMGITLTENGEAFLEDAKRVINIMEPWYNNAAEQKIIYLFSVGYIADYMIPYLISHCKSSKLNLRTEGNFIYRKSPCELLPDYNRPHLCFDFILEKSSNEILKQLQENGWKYEILGTGMSYVFFNIENPLLKKATITLEDLISKCTLAYFGEYSRLKSELLSSILYKFPEDKQYGTGSREATFRLISSSPDMITVGSFPAMNQNSKNSSYNIVAKQIDGISDQLVLIAFYPASISSKLISPIFDAARTFLDSENEIFLI